MTAMLRRCGDCTLCCRLLPMQNADKSPYTPERIAKVVEEMTTAGMARPADFAGMMSDFDKPAGERCPHQRHGAGCAVYPRRPFGCRIWNCRWLVSNDTRNLSRPDRTGYVIDIMPDFVTLDPGDGSPRMNLEVVAIWVDQRRPDAWRRDKQLWAYLERRGREGIAALIRFNAHDGLTIFPPGMSSDGRWNEIRGKGTAQHLDVELIAGLARCRPVKLEVPKQEEA